MVTYPHAGDAFTASSAVLSVTFAFGFEAVHFGGSNEGACSSP